MTSAPMTSFGARLDAVTRERGRFCIGIDPHPSLLNAWGLPDDHRGLESFARSAVEALAGIAAVIKPQSAFFERHGSRGVSVLEQTIADARAAGALVLLDVKRGDIGSTVQAYADAYLDPASPLCADAITATPYLGFESLTPLVETALAHGNGVFVVTLTSNPEGGEVQQARAADGRTVGETMLEHVRALNSAAAPLGSIGCVVGATLTEAPADLDVGGPLLAPGIGAQGATTSALSSLFGSALPHVLPSSSRQILASGPDPEALRAAARRAIGEFTLLLRPETR